MRRWVLGWSGVEGGTKGGTMLAAALPLPPPAANPPRLPPPSPLQAGGFVADGRVNGSLNLSRALGDAEHKRTPGVGPEAQAVTAVPEVRSATLQAGDSFLLLACDGIWDIMTHQEAVDFVSARLEAGDAPSAAASALCDACLAPDTGGCGKGCDNMSALVVVLKPFAPPGYGAGTGVGACVPKRRARGGG